MNKRLLPLLITIFISSAVYAQISGGGKPFSMDQRKNVSLQSTPAQPEISYLDVLSSSVPQVSLQPVNVALLQEEDKNRPAGLDNGMCRIGALIPADIRYPSSGSSETLASGEKTWFLQVKVADAAALGLYFDQFFLPAGVRLFVFNKNGKQVLGSFSSRNNAADRSFATEKVQGDLVNIELDMDANADASKILFHINNVTQFYKAVGYLEDYKTKDNDLAPESTYFPWNQSSPCEINAVCPLGEDNPIQRDASLHIEYIAGQFAYAASGTMMNNTAQDGTPYMLTASHVEPTNSTSNSTYNLWIFYFNYQTPTCTYTGGQPSTKQTMIGATFKARSSYDSSSGKIAGDFLLLELKDSVPYTYGAFLSGWNNSTSTPSGTCICFHHPSADVKKVSTSSNISPNGNFNGGETNSHWQVKYGGATGGIEEGSSGSGLFDPKGYFIGDLSGGAINSPSCTTKNAAGEEITNLTEYSKLSNDWLYTFQTPSSSATRLKDWLDPLNTGDVTFPSVPTTLKPTGINNPSDGNLKSQVELFPNPTSGMLMVKLNAAVPGDLEIRVFNMMGCRVSELQISQATAGEYKIDLSQNAAGIYMVQVRSGNSEVTEKVILSK